MWYAPAINMTVYANFLTSLIETFSVKCIPIVVPIKQLAIERKRGLIILEVRLPQIILLNKTLTVVIIKYSCSVAWYSIGSVMTES